MIKLNNGVEMPQIGLGTFNISPNDFVKVIGDAYELGYRKFDTAWKCQNENLLSNALKNNHIRREDVFITTKIHADALFYWGYYYGKKSVFNIRNFKTISRVVEKSFKNLQTDYIDLFLVHWPYPMFGEMYRCLEKFYQRGVIRAIGVSSFLPPHLEVLKNYSNTIPAVNQFEISPLNTQKALINYCHQQNIVVEAMSTFSHFRSSVPRKEILDNDLITSISQKYGKTNSQVILRWLIQQGIAIIPKSSQYNHLKENISLFDFELTLEEMELIDSLDRGKFLNYNPYRAIKGLPSKYKSWQGFKDECF